MPAAPEPIANQHPKLVRAALLAVAALPAIAIIVLICIYAINVPFYDEWNMAEVFRNYENHKLSIHDFIASHSEHRPVIPNIVYFITTYLAHGDVRANMFVNVGSACLISLAIYSLSRSAGRYSVNQALLLLIPANIFMFGTIQSENWLWGTQGHLPAATVVVCLAVAASGLKPNIKFPLCILLALAASFTLAYGLCAWVVTLPVLLVRDESPRDRKIWIVLWLLFLVLSILPYTMGAHKPGAGSPLLIFANYPLAIFNYFFVLLGTPLASGLAAFGLWPVYLVGTIMTAFVLFHSLYFLRHIRDVDFRNEAVIWIALIAFPMATAVMITLGRVTAGVVQATSSRYTTVTALLVVALIYLTRVVLKHHRSKKPNTFSELTQARAVTATLTVVLCLHAVTTMGSFRDIETRRRFMLGVKTLVTWSQVAYDEKDIGTNVSGPPTNVRELADSLDRQGLLSPKLVRTDIITDAAASVGGGGKLELAATRDDMLVFEGWAELPDRQDIADGVLLCWSRPGEPRHVFAVTMERKMRPEIAKSLGDPRYVWCGWTAKVPISRAPADATDFSAFAYDSLNSRVYQLGR